MEFDFVGQEGWDFPVERAEGVTESELISKSFVTNLFCHCGAILASTATRVVHHDDGTVFRGFSRSRAEVSTFSRSSAQIA